jgi:hypothetical protein
MPLTADRAKPAVPVAGNYRLVDFALSNLVNAGYLKIAVLTQYKSHSLDRHVTPGNALRTKVVHVMSFSWSFSKLDNFETCAKKFYEYYVAKNVKDDSTENIDWGNEVHDAMRDALRKVKPLPEVMKPYQKWVDRVLAGPGDLLVEQKYALDSTLSPCPYFAPVVWYRGIADVVRIDGPVGLAIDVYRAQGTRASAP